MQEKIEGRVVVLPAGYDPDAFLREYGNAAFQKVAAEAAGIIPFLISTAEKRHGRSIEGKIRIVEDMIAPLAAIEDTIARSLHIKALAEHIGIEETAIMEKVRQVVERRGAQVTRGTDRAYTSAAGTTPPDSDSAKQRQTDQLTGDAGRLESKIIAMMLQFPEIMNEINENQVLAYFGDNSLKAIGQTVLAHKNFTNADVTDIINKMPDTASKSVVAALSIQDDSWDHEGCRRLIAQFLSSRSRRQNSLLRKIREAEESNNLELLLELLKKKQHQARSRQGSNLTSGGG
jgi:DNA primase